MKKLIGMLLLGATLLLADGIHWEADYKAAVKKAGTENKPIFFVFSSHDCKWCRRLEDTTFSDPQVIKTLNDDFINVIAYTDAGDYVPRGLWVPGTPALWFLDANGEAMFQPIQGAVGAQEFLKATTIVRQEYEKLQLQQTYGNRKRQ